MMRIRSEAMVPILVDSKTIILSCQTCGRGTSLGAMPLAFQLSWPTANWARCVAHFSMGGGVSLDKLSKANDLQVAEVGLPIR